MDLLSWAYGLLGAALLVVGVLFITWITFQPLIIRLISSAPLLVAHRTSRIAEGLTCSFPTRDGIRLRGTFLPQRGTQRAGTIIYCHELHADRNSAGAYVEPLRAAGFDVFAFDFRNHGASDGKPGYRPLPWAARCDVDDVHAAIRLVCRRFAPPSLILFGISKGATAALCAAAEDRRVNAVVADSLVPPGRMHMHYYFRFIPVYIPSALLRALIATWFVEFSMAFGRLLVSWRLGSRIQSAEQAARNLRQPMLLIQGERDTFVPTTVVRQLRRCLASHNSLWIVAGAKHNSAIDVAPQEYENRVLRFLRRHATRHEPAPVVEVVSPSTAEAVH